MLSRESKCGNGNINFHFDQDKEEDLFRKFCVSYMVLKYIMSRQYNSVELLPSMHKALS